MGHAFVDSVSECVATREKAQRDALNADMDLAELTAEAIAATEQVEAQQAAQVEAQITTQAAAQNILSAHREHIQTLENEISFLRQLLADNPLLITAAPQIELRITQLSQLAVNIKRTVAIEVSWAQKAM